MNIFKKKPVIFFMSSQNDGCNWYRCYLPAKELKKHGWKVGISIDNFRNPDSPLKKDKQTIKLLEQADIIVLQRLASQSVIFFIEGLKKIKPRKIVFESDDLVEKIYKNNLGSLFWNKERIYWLDEVIKKCDLLTVSTNFLKEKWKVKNEKIAVLPNNLNFDLIPKIEKKHKKRKLKVLLSGSCIYPENLDYLVLKEIAKQYELVIFGVPVMNEEVGKIVKEKNPDFYYQLRNILKPIEELKEKYRVELLPNVMFGNYYDYLSQLDIDVAIIPRSNIDFNKAKSNLKILEMGAFEIPCVVSMIDEYQEFIDKELVLGVKNKKDWLFQLKKLENPELREELAKKNYQYIYENYNIKKNYIFWDKIYRQLL